MTPSNRQYSSRILVRGGALGATLALAISGLAALGTGRSFLTLDPGFDQELWAVTQLPPDDDGFATILGGVAFAPDGDVWSAECVFRGTTLHRFDKQTSVPLTNGTSTLHAEVGSGVQTLGGCGLTNHPDGSIYSNSDLGVFKLNASTGLPVSTAPMGAPGNALGIAVDPSPSHHVVYAGADCHPQTGAGIPTCTIFDLNPADGVLTIFAQFTKVTTNIVFVDGLYFEPGGQFLFMASRSAAEGSNALSVVRRPSASPVFPDDSQLVQNVPMSREPDGVAFFNGTPKFVVTLDEASGSMTRFDFPTAAGVPDYAASPSQTDFATGGFRGDLLQVGADGCIYATQGRRVLPTDFATRYDNDVTTTEDSIVRICSKTPGGFAVPPGVDAAAPTTGRIGDFVWNDLDRDGIQDAGEPGLATTVTLRKPDGTFVASTTSNAAGFYEFTGLTLGSYVVDAAMPAGFAPTTAFVGGSATDSNGSPAGVTLSTAHPEDVSIDFGFQALRGSISGTTFKDYNRNGVKDAGEPEIGNVNPIVLSGAAAASTSTDASGAYAFTNLLAGSYQVTAPSAWTGGLTLFTSPTYTNPRNVPLAAGQNKAGVDFGYVNDTPPTCWETLNPGTPFSGTMWYSAPNGLKTLVVTENLNNNFAVTMPTFTPGTTATVGIAAVLINPNLSAQVTGVATDMFGNQVACDPVVATLVRDSGRETPETYRGIPYAESFVTIENDETGLRGLDIIVNGRLFKVRGLKDGQDDGISVASAMHPGTDNTMTLIARGRPGGSALITIAAPTHTVHRRQRH